MYLKVWFLCAMVLLAVTTRAQVVMPIDEAAEQWAEEFGNETVAGELNDLLISLRGSPVNLNDTHAVALLPLLTPFQQKALKNYILLHGQLLTINELVMIPGYDSATIRMLSSIAKVEPYTERNGWHLNEGQVTMVSGISGTVEQAKGYSDGTYDGDNLHALTTISYNYRNHLDIRLSYDKDPMEAWGKDNYFGYHLMLNDVWRIEKLIVGRFNLQFGQGVTLWTGLAPFQLLGQGGARFGRGVRAASTFYEEGYQEGVATTMRLGKGFHASGFASKTHGTRILGANIQYRTEGLLAGVTLCQSRLDDSLSIRDYVYNQDYFRGTELVNMGADMVWEVGRLTVYGEIGFDDKWSTAGIVGAKLSGGGRHAIGVSYRRYDADYHNLNAQAYCIGSTRNERGITLDAKVGLPWGMDALLSTDLHQFPSLKYGAYSPTSGEWLRLQVEKLVGKHGAISVRYSHRRKERNIPNIDSALYVEESTLRQQLQAEMKLTAGRWTFKMRLTECTFDTESGIGQSGWLAMQDAQYSGKHLTMAVSVAGFDINGYYARIYLNERQLQYMFTVPSFQGKGGRGYVMLRYAVSPSLTVSAKYAITIYADRETVGSGAAETEGNTRQTWMLQLRWKLRH